MSQAIRVAKGDYIDYTPGADVAAGAVVVLGNFVFVAERAIAANVLGALAVNGIYDIAKVDALAMSVGDAVYWDADGDPKDGDAGTGALTKTANGNTFAGIVVMAALAGDATVRIALRSIEAAAAESLSLANLSDVGALDYTAGRLLVADGDSFEDVALSGDATLAGNGALTIANTAVNAAKLAADAVETAKIKDANVTTAKLAAGAATLPKVTFTGLKMLAAAGNNGAGAINLAGAAVGDRVIAVFGAPTAGGALEVPAANAFEAAITVINQVQQAAVGDLSTKTYIFILAPATA